MPDAVNLTDSAIKHMEGLIEKTGKPIVRLQMKGGGCAGFSYDWQMSDSKELDDEIINFQVVNLLLIVQVYYIL